MKTTVELPDDLVKAVKYRAVRDGRKFKDVVADLLQEALSRVERLPDVSDQTKNPWKSIDPRSGFPVVHGSPDAPARKMTIEQILALEQQAQEEEDLQRSGLSPRR